MGCLKMIAFLWLMLAVKDIDAELTTESPLPELIFSTQDLDFELHEYKTVNLTLSGAPSECVNITFSTEDLWEDIDPIYVCQDSRELTWLIYVNSTNNGKAVLSATAEPQGIVNDEDAFIRVGIMLHSAINVVGDVLGWIYTIAWDISFLPQIYHNWRRRSVTGLAFDFLCFNFIGFFCYFLFNMGNLWIPSIQEQFLDRNPTAVMHVRLNDVIFPLYALLCTAVQILQCFFYKKEPGQRVSTPCIVISALLLLSAVVALIVVAATEKFWWIDLLYWLSYIKLAITCIKYTPQLYVNYKHKSTEGWSIWQVILDFTGGTLSLIQMFMLASNYDDWKSVLTDPAKLGLGLLSIFFNIFFFMQHFCLYRGSKIQTDFDKSRKGSTSSKRSDSKGYVNHDPSVHI
ncbi:hypothetical protein SK128_015149 [Halocaridina rubra]|uniref:Cystinosin n=1 Tax=Halocaridina rubra TaxID=373956 RepID=A0AAN9A3L9_HALRR